MTLEPKLDYQSQILTVQSLYLLPAYGTREPSLKEKAKPSEMPKKLPKAQYMLNILMPTVGVVDNNPPLYIGTSFDGDHSTVEAQASVYIQAVYAGLVVRADARCPSDVQWSSKDTIEYGEDEIIKGNGNFRFRYTQLTDRLDMRLDMTLLMDLPVFAPRFPTFKTLDTSCQYRLQVQIGTMCGKMKRYDKAQGELYRPKIFTMMRSIKDLRLNVGDAI